MRRARQAYPHRQCASSVDRYAWVSAIQCDDAHTVAGALDRSREQRSSAYCTRRNESRVACRASPFAALFVTAVRGAERRLELLLEWVRHRSVPVVS